MSAEHYRKNHLGRPHEYLVSGMNPEGQQRPPEKNETAYIFLYIALGAAGLLLLVMLYGVWRDHRKKSKERLKAKQQGAKNRGLFGGRIGNPKESNVIYPDVNKTELGNGGGSIKSRSTSNGTNLYTTGTTSAGGSVPSMTTIPEEVQPPGQDPHSYPNNHTHTAPIGQLLYQQSIPNNQRPRAESVVQVQSSTTYPDLKSEEQSYSSKDGDQSRARPRQVSREESFPYEKYGIPMEDREPRTTRVENMRPLSDYLKLSPGDSFYQLEEEEEYSPESSASSGRGETSPLRGTATAPQEDDAQQNFYTSDTLPLREHHQNK